MNYHDGKGVIKDYEAEFEFYKLAAEQEHIGAQGNIGLMYHDGNGVMQDNIKSHMWWNIASSLGDETTKSLRDSLEKDMNSAQIAKAQKLAR